MRCIVGPSSPLQKSGKRIRRRLNRQSTENGFSRLEPAILAHLVDRRSSSAHGEVATSGPAGIDTGHDLVRRSFQKVRRIEVLEAAFKNVAEIRNFDTPKAETLHKFWRECRNATVGCDHDRIPGHDLLVLRLRASGEYRRYPFDLAHVQRIAFGVSPFEYRRQEIGHILLVVARGKAAGAVRAFEFIDAETDLRDQAVSAEFVVGIGSRQPIGVKNADDIRLEARILQAPQRADRQLPGWLVVARPSPQIMKVLRPIDAQADRGVGAPEQFDPVFVDGDTVRLHRKTSGGRCYVAQPLIRVLVPGNRSRGRFARMPDNRRRAISIQIRENPFANRFYNGIRHQVPVVAVTEIAIAAPDIAVRRRLQHDQARPPHRSAIAPIAGKAVPEIQPLRQLFRRRSRPPLNWAIGATRFGIAEQPT